MRLNTRIVREVYSGIKLAVLFSKGCCSDSPIIHLKCFGRRYPNIQVRFLRPKGKNSWELQIEVLVRDNQN